MILEYFVPGFIFLITFNYLTSRKHGSYVIIGSVVISYLFKSICTYLHSFIFISKEFKWNERVIILSIISFLISLIVTFASERKFVNNIFLKINNKSVHDDIWQDTIDYKNGTTLRITCQDSIYTGTLVCHEEKGLDSWFILCDYIIEENDNTQCSKDVTYNSQLAINLKNVKRIELYFGEVYKKKSIMDISRNIIHKFTKRKNDQQEQEN